MIKAELTYTKEYLKAMNKHAKKTYLLFDVYFLIVIIWGIKISIESISDNLNNFLKFGGYVNYKYLVFTIICVIVVTLFAAFL